MKKTMRMSIALALNILFSIIEFVCGFLFQSSSIMTDAVHDFSDGIAILLAIIFEKISEKEPDLRYNLGYARFSNLGALITVAILILSSFMMLIKNLDGLIEVPIVDTKGMFLVGIFGFIINLLASKVISHKHHHGEHNHEHDSMNEKVLKLHFLEDVLGWLAVIIVSLIIPITNWHILDPLLGLIISIFILSKAIIQLVKILRIFLNARPDDLMKVNSLKRDIVSLPHIEKIEELVIIEMSENHRCGMIKITVSKDCPVGIIKNELRIIFNKFRIKHCFIDVEKD